MYRASKSSTDRIVRQRGMSLFVVLAVGVTVSLLLMGLVYLSGNHLLDSKAEHRRQREHFLADGGFNLLQAKIAEINSNQGGVAVNNYLGSLKKVTQAISLGGNQQGFFRLDDFHFELNPLTVELQVQGSLDGVFDKMRPMRVEGIVRVPSLARYARYIEGTETLNYKAGTVTGEVLVAGNINLVEETVVFKNLVSTGERILNQFKGQFDFGFRENELSLPTLDGVHINSWDTYPFDPSNPSMVQKTFESKAKLSGIVLMPDWRGKNSSAACQSTGPCDTVFAACYDLLGETRRSSAVVAGSAVFVDLAEVRIDGDEIVVEATPVLYDFGPSGGDGLLLANASKIHRRKLMQFGSGTVYFPGDIYLTGKLENISLTIAAGDDVFLMGEQIGPDKDEVDSDERPVVLGVVAQDQVLIHEGTPRKITIRAAILAENDEIIFRSGNTDLRYGYVCKNEIFTPPGLSPTDNYTFRDFFDAYFIWDDNRQVQVGFGREADEECVDLSCNGENRVVQNYGFAVLGADRSPSNGEWLLDFDGSLITRLPGSKGPLNKCNLGWDCDSEPDRSRWNYDTRLGVISPPGFPSPVVGDRSPSLVVGYKERSFK